MIASYVSTYENAFLCSFMTIYSCVGILAEVNLDLTLVLLHSGKRCGLFWLARPYPLGYNAMAGTLYFSLTPGFAPLTQPRLYYF